MVKRTSSEYQTCKAIAAYLRWQYPGVLYHFDLAGLNLSRAQAGMMKGIQHSTGWPDLFIAEPSADGRYHGLFIEVKADGVRVRKRDGSPATEHIGDQFNVLYKLAHLGYRAEMAVGFDEARKMIDEYLR